MFQAIVDLLSSIAAFVAVVTVLVAWAKDRRSAIEVSRVIISPIGDKTRAFVELHNIKDYAVVVAYLACHSRSTYQVQREPGGKPSMFPSVSSNDQLFADRSSTELAERGKLMKEYTFERGKVPLNNLVFRLNTSHGNYLLKPRSIRVFSKQISVVPEDSVVFKESRIQAGLIWAVGYVRYLWECLIIRFS